MDGSIEMKIQLLEKIIDSRNALIQLQDEARMWCSFDENSAVLMYDAENLFAYAEYLGVPVVQEHTPECLEDTVCVSFCYKNVKFTGYCSRKEEESNG